jgi:hypothetical protein
MIDLVDLMFSNLIEFVFVKLIDFVQVMNFRFIGFCCLSVAKVDCFC